MNVRGYLATLITASLRLNTHFFSKVRDQVWVRFRFRVEVRVKAG